MKRAALLLPALFICLSLLSLAPEPASDAAFSGRVLRYITQQHDTLITELAALNKSISAREPDAAKKNFLLCRERYKKTEAFIAWFFPGDARFINGPDQQEIEDDDEPDFIIYPHGFQVIEGMLFENNWEDNTQRLHDESDSLIEQFKKSSAALNSMNITPRIFFESMQLELIRLFMLTAVDFETPKSRNAVAEVISGLQGLQEIISAAYPFEYSGRSNVLRVFISTADSAAAYLAGCKSAEQIDYLKLYSRYYIPLSDQLRTGRGNLVEGDYQSTTAIDLNAASVFDQAAFNTFFFNPTQTKTGSTERASLGRLLFFDPVLSENNLRSCASCHQPEKAFTDGLPKSISTEKKTPLNRNAPTLINAALQGRLFLDARAMNLEKQAGEVLDNPLEMHHDFSSSVDKLKRSHEYETLFRNAFSGTADTIITSHSVLLAIAEYERSLVSLNSRFDKTIRGEADMLSDDERQGFNLFITKGKCAGCHFLPLFSGSVPPEYKKSDWEVIGTPRTNDANVHEIDPDAGRGGVHRTSLYRYAFKTPSLRNAALTAPYMHNGVFNSLEEVLDFYNAGGGRGRGIDVPNQTLPADSLKLTQNEKHNIIAFLNALSDTSGLTSRPEALPSFPDSPQLNNRRPGGE